jgi:quercetin dioxygenase-like cupin family protein
MELLKDIAAKAVVKGINGHYVHGQEMTFGLIHIDKGSDLPEHQHVHEQITYMLEGQLDMIIGGIPYTLTPGMIHVIPSNTPHSAKAITNCTLIDVFSPVREDYKTM